MQPDRFGMDTISLAGPLEARLRAIREAGFTQIMLSAHDIVSHPGGDAAAIQAVKQSGLRVTGFQVLRDFEGLPGEMHLYKMDIAKAMLALCRAVGANVLLVCSTTSAHAGRNAGAFARDLGKLAMLAAPFEIRIAYEALSWGRHVSNVNQAWRVVERAARANLGVAVDSYHMLATGTPVEALDAMPPEKIFLVQLSDFIWNRIRTFDERRETARHFRVFPGEGAHSDSVVALIKRLERIGYCGDYSFEVFNDDYVQLPLRIVADRARQSVNWILANASRREGPLRRFRGSRAGGASDGSDRSEASDRSDIPPAATTGTGVQVLHQ